MANDTFGFGQRVKLELYEKFNETGTPVFTTSDLRIDFTIKKISEYVRGQVSIYNLSKSTTDAISDKGKYFSLFVSLHGKPWAKLVDNMYVNNIYTERQVPNSITTLYGYSSQIGVLDKEIEFTIGLNLVPNYALDHVEAAPTVRRILVESLKRAIGYSKVQWIGENGKPQPLIWADTKIRFENFSSESAAKILDGVQTFPYITIEGSLVEIFRDYCLRYGMIYFSEGKDFVFSYLPTYRSVKYSSYHDNSTNKETSFTIPIHHIRSNPVVTPAKITMDVNLDLRITTGKMINTKELIDVGAAKVGTSAEVLALAKDFIPDTIKKSYPYYNVLSVTHMGSNYTSSWQTSFDAYSARDNAKLGDENNGSL